ncbi:hypothetical protein KL86SPO_40147 [uncultured Sporomusa sp.]|uniref:Uncharacterized protein n=1 Tax=uncultured Sporomusa sp. TaxID=307249 RepID=A0A212LVU6_9FIRM|nr:hypothetical protein KL86SPO_40147 [uncultured Sporomusa sp.]
MAWRIPAVTEFFYEVQQTAGAGWQGGAYLFFCWRQNPNSS